MSGKLTEEQKAAVLTLSGALNEATRLGLFDGAILENVEHVDSINDVCCAVDYVVKNLNNWPC